MDQPLCPSCLKLKREVAQLRDEIEELETERADPSSTRKASQRSSDDERVIRALESSVKDLRQQLHLSAEDLAEAREAQELADVRIASMQQQLVHPHTQTARALHEPRARQTLLRRRWLVRLLPPLLRPLLIAAAAGLANGLGAHRAAVLEQCRHELDRLSHMQGRVGILVHHIRICSLSDQRCSFAKISELMRSIRSLQQK